MYRDLPSRHTIRIPGYDYSLSNWYYVTICTHKRSNIFSEIVDPVGARRGSPVMQNNLIGNIIEKIWHSIPQHHNISVDSFQIMPNHLHGIIIINHTGEPRLAPTLCTVDYCPQSPPIPRSREREEII